MNEKTSASFLAAFRAHAGAAGTMSFADFMALALYHPEIGYYRRQRTRVGYGPGTDFFTASTSEPVFGELVAAACATLVRTHGGAPQEHVFVEIGAETDGGVLAGIVHPFAGVRTLQLGEPLNLGGRCVVFSNELFDAQPCRRFVRRGGAWRELGVAERDGQLVEIELPSVSAQTHGRDARATWHGRPAHVADNPNTSSERPEPWLPLEAPEGYVLDAPRAAAALAKQIAAQPWSGLFVALDYGKSWTALAEETPAGTVRAYHRHTQSDDLLAQPGEQDLTCHVCWDWLSAALTQDGFGAPQLDSQEAFFVHHAAEYLAATAAAEATRLSQKKLSLLQLLHPAHLGQKFQALHAWRR